MSLQKRRLDVSTVLGLTVGIGAVLGGHLLEEGKVKDVLKGPAAVIVLGGCLGAVLMANPLRVVVDAARRTRDLFFEPFHDHGAQVDEMVAFSTKARKNGIVSLEKEAMAIQDPFLRKAILLAVDGVDLAEIRSTMELEIALEEERIERAAKVYEAAGGYAPTIGIIGAVMGLILVMDKIADTEAVGHGIASAFVATIYGVGLANLILLPAGQKVRMRARAESERRELVLEGVVGIAEGLNPKLIRGKLEAYLEKPPEKKTEPGGARADDRRAVEA